MSKCRFDLLPDAFDAMLVAAGADPGKLIFREVAKRSQVRIALDGGTAIFRRYRIKPDYVIGDMDSASRDMLQWAKRGGALIRCVRTQNTSDLEKGLAFCRKKRWKHLAVLASDGDRPDHTIYALDAAFRLTELNPLMISACSIIHFLRSPLRLDMHIPKNHSISWLGWPEAKNCTMSGVRWSFRNRTLQLSGFQSLSNFATKNTISMSSSSGNSLLVVGLTPDKLT